MAGLRQNGNSPTSRNIQSGSELHLLAAEPAAVMAKEFFHGQVMSIFDTPERRMGRAGPQGRSQP